MCLEFNQVIYSLSESRFGLISGLISLTKTAKVQEVCLKAG